jgi:hypothetical protein
MRRLQSKSVEEQGRRQRSKAMGTQERPRTWMFSARSQSGHQTRPPAACIMVRESAAAAAAVYLVYHCSCLAAARKHDAVLGAPGGSFAQYMGLKVTKLREQVRGGECSDVLPALWAARQNKISPNSTCQHNPPLLACVRSSRPIQSTQRPRAPFLPACLSSWTGTRDRLHRCDSATHNT